MNGAWASCHAGYPPSKCLEQVKCSMDRVSKTKGEKLQHTVHMTSMINQQRLKEFYVECNLSFLTIVTLNLTYPI